MIYLKYKLHTTPLPFLQLYTSMHVSRFYYQHLISDVFCIYCSFRYSTHLIVVTILPFLSPLLSVPFLFHQFFIYFHSEFPFATLYVTLLYVQHTVSCFCPYKFYVLFQLSPFHSHTSFLFLQILQLCSSFLESSIL